MRRKIYKIVLLFPLYPYRLDPVLYRKCQGDASRLCHTHGWNETSELMPPGAVFSCLYRHAYRTEEQGRRVCCYLWFLPKPFVFYLFWFRSSQGSLSGVCGGMGGCCTRTMSIPAATVVHQLLSCVLALFFVTFPDFLSKIWIMNHKWTIKFCCSNFI